MRSCGFLGPAPRVFLSMCRHPTDDGITWWSVRGRPASDSDSTKATSAVEIDFSPKGGPAAARATFSALTGMLRFADGNGWTRVEPVPVPGGSTVEGS